MGRAQSREEDRSRQQGIVAVQLLKGSMLCGSIHEPHKGVRVSIKKGEWLIVPYIQARRDLTLNPRP
jgi:hypothetical protein